MATYNQKITLEKAVEIYDKYSSGDYTMPELSVEYGVSRTRIEQILRLRPLGLDKVRPPLPFRNATLQNGRKMMHIREDTLDKLVVIAYLRREKREQQEAARVLGLSKTYVSSLTKRYADELNVIKDRINVLYPSKH